MAIEWFWNIFWLFSSWLYFMVWILWWMSWYTRMEDLTSFGLFNCFYRVGWLFFSFFLFSFFFFEFSWIFCIYWWLFFQFVGRVCDSLINFCPKGRGKISYSFSSYIPCISWLYFYESMFQMISFFVNKEKNELFG